jgi:hypothetical protein
MHSPIVHCSVYFVSPLQVDLELSGSYNCDEDAVGHVLAVVDVSAAMEPLLPEIKAALKEIVDRPTINAHLTMYSRSEADDASMLNLAADTMGMKAGEAVSLEEEVSTVRIKCSWANAVEGVPCDLDSGIVLYEGTQKWDTCSFENTDVGGMVTLNTDARGDSAESEEILVCRLDKLPLSVTSAVVYLCNYGGGTFENAAEVEIEVDDVGALIAGGDTIERLRTEPGHGLARASSNSVVGLSARGALVMGAFNRLPAGANGKTHWYFESVQQVTDGRGPDSDGMKATLSSYMAMVDEARVREAVKHKLMQELEKRRASFMAATSPRAVWRATPEGALNVSTNVKKIQSESTLSYRGEPGEFVNSAIYSDVFDVLKEEVVGRKGRPFSPFKSIETLVLECTEKFTGNNDHHVTVVWVNSGSEPTTNSLWLCNMQKRIDELALRRIFVRVCVAPVHAGLEHESGVIANALSSLSFDSSIHSVECLSRGDGSIARPPLWAKLSIGAAIKAIAADVIDVAAYLQLAMVTGPDCRIPITLSVRADDLAGFGERAAAGGKCIDAGSFDLAALMVMIQSKTTNESDRPKLVWNHRKPEQPKYVPRVMAYVSVSVFSSLAKVVVQSDPTSALECADNRQQINQIQISHLSVCPLIMETLLCSYRTEGRQRCCLTGFESKYACSSYQLNILVEKWHSSIGDRFPPNKPKMSWLVGCTAPISYENLLHGLTHTSFR